MAGCRNAHNIMRREKMVVLLNMKMKPYWRTARYVAILSRPDALHRTSMSLPKPGRSLPRAASYPEFGQYRLLLCIAEGRIFGGCEFIRQEDRPRVKRNMISSHTFTQIVGVVAEQPNRANNNVDYDLLCRERDNFRILVAIGQRRPVASGY